MPIAVLGSAGLGLVWGWLNGSIGRRVRHSPRTALMLGAATLLLGAEVLLLAGWRALLVYLAATALAVLCHLRWRRGLAARFRPPT